MTNVSTLAHNLLIRSQIADIQSRIVATESEVASGKKAQVYSGLGNEARPLINLNALKQGVEAYQNNISITELRMDRMQQVLQRINDIAVDVRNQALTAIGQTGDPTYANLLKSAAESALREVTQLLNGTLDGRSLFGGRDTASSPMIAPGQVGTVGTPLDDVAAITGALGAPDPALTVLENVRTYFGVPLTTDPPGTPAGPAASFYQGDTTGNISARIDEGIDVDYGIRGDDLGLRKILAGLYTLATTDLTAANAAEWDQLATLVVQNDFNTGIDDVNSLVADLGLQQSRVADAKQRHADTIDQLEIQIGDIENADPAESITLLQLLQTQLQASFQVTASLRDLTLTNFLR